MTCIADASVSRALAVHEVDDSGGQFAGLDRLGEVDVIAGQDRALAVFRAGQGGEGDGGDASADVRGHGADPRDQAVAVLVRHADVAHEHIRLERGENVERFTGGGGGGDVRAAVAE